MDFSNVTISSWSNDKNPLKNIIVNSDNGSDLQGVTLKVPNNWYGDKDSGGMIYNNDGKLYYIGTQDGDGSSNYYIN